MPGSKRRIPFGGVEIEVEDANIVRSSEQFNEYELDDGTVVRVKGVLTDLMKVVGAQSPDGKPVYLAQVSPVVVVR